MIGCFLAVMRAPVPQNIDPQNDLRYFSWALFAFVSLIFSAFVFKDEISKNGPHIFSKQNARSASEVLALHGAFIVMLFCLMRVLILIVPILPYWMTDTFNAGRGARASILHFVFVVLATGLAFIERKWLFVESTTRKE